MLSSSGMFTRPYGEPLCVSRGWARRRSPRLVTTAKDKVAMVEEWDARSNGIAWAIQQVSSDPSGDLRAAVEDTLDSLLATPG